MLRTKPQIALLSALAFVGCDGSAIVEPELQPDFARVAAGAPAHQVSGGGTVDVPDGRSTYAFHAMTTKDGGVRGTVELHFSSAPVTVHGNVTCLSVDGNQAWLGAVITRSDAGEGNFDVGGEIVWRAVDNGQGSNADPDLVSSFSGRFTADFCETQFDSNVRDWSNGNVQIR